MKNIRFLVMDVDGTLTDGKIYMGENGELCKAFSIKDGYGIKELLPQHNILPVIITARTSKILQNRCDELGIAEVHQGIRDKIGKLRSILEAYSISEGVQYSLRDVAYIGDDLLDMRCIKPVKEVGGLIGCPADAAGEIIAIADYTCRSNGGEGAVREFITWMISQ